MGKNMTADTCDGHLTLGSRAFFGSALAIVAVIGTVGNSILAHFIMRKSERRSHINILLATMAISDTLISLICTPFDLLAIVYNEWIFNQQTCSVHSFILSFFVVLTATVLIILSVDRYSILVLKKDRLRGCHMAAVVSSCIVASAVLSIPPVFDSSNMIFANEHCRQTYKKTQTNVLYSLTYSCLLFVLPFGLLLLAYVHIIVAIRKAKRTVLPQDMCSSLARPVRVNVQFKQKTFSTILCLYGAAMVCKLPLALSVFFKSFSEYAVCPVAQWIMLLTYFNSAVNPLIYAVKISEYWLVLAGKLCKKRSQVMSFKRKTTRRSQPQTVYIIPSKACTPTL